MMTIRVAAQVCSCALWKHMSSLFIVVTVF